MSSNLGRTSESRPPRWRPAIGIIVVSAVALSWNWFVADESMQGRIFFMALIVALASLLLLLWLLIFSRLRWRIRFMGLAAFLSVILLVSMSFRIRGFTGDVVPILEWR
ncbi:MAG TPA: hypothetical protein VMY18_07905 [Acidobacteriota bacterium]|nr:hypothetical protein [Acidobacteriota bacterium]